MTVKHVAEECNSDFVDILKCKDRNPNKYNREHFTPEGIEKVWTIIDDKYYQIILMLLYNGIRKVSIADNIMQFYKN